MSSDELAAEARACLIAGATAIHLHVRDPQGRHSLDPELYVAATEAVRAATEGNMVVQITTEAVGVFTPAQQIATVRSVCPEAVSLAVRELIPDQLSESVAGNFLSWAQGRKIGVQYVLYDPADIRRVVELQRNGVIPHERPHVLLVLGRYAKNLTSDPSELAPMLAELPEHWAWSLCAFGNTEAQCMQAAIDRRGHCRVGFENNLQGPDGKTAEGNATLVENVTEMARLSPRSVGTIQDARRLYLE